MDTGTRDMALKVGDFVEDFNYDKWQQLVANGTLEEINVATIEENKENNKGESQED
jgi:hypothetical protein